MRRTARKRSKKVGASPGTLMHIGAEPAQEIVLEVTEYDAAGAQTRQLKEVSEFFPCKHPPNVTWINVEGLSDVGLLQEIGNCFGIHPLVLEDVLATDQRAKVEDYGSYLFVVLKMLALGEGPAGIRSEQVSFILGDHFLLSFQEGVHGDVFDPVRARLQLAHGHLRTGGPDYLLYSLMDVVVDNYFLVVEMLAERIEDLEDQVVGRGGAATLQEINFLKREMLFLHRAVWPLREAVGTLQRRESTLIKDATLLFLRDLYDHTVQVLETLESLREMLSGLLDIYLSSASNRLNVVMKVLTIIATIFMPLSFIAGIYGMNFRYMPELEWHYGYPMALLLMLGLAVGMLLFFRKKGWL